MDIEQEKVRDWLQNYSIDLAELYAAGIAILNSTDLPGKQILVCHCAREIINRLPVIVTETASSGRYESSKKLATLREQWFFFELNVFAAESTTAELSSERPGVEIPRPFYDLLNQTLTEYTQVSETNFDLALNLFVTLSNESISNKDNLRPLVKDWRILATWFNSKVHVTNARESRIADGELSTHFIKFDVILQSLAATFFEGVKRLDEILAETNK